MASVSFSTVRSCCINSGTTDLFNSKLGSEIYSDLMRRFAIRKLMALVL